MLGADSDSYSSDMESLADEYQKLIGQAVKEKQPGKEALDDMESMAEGYQQVIGQALKNAKKAKNPGKEALDSMESMAEGYQQVIGQALKNAKKSKAKNPGNDALEDLELLAHGYQKVVGQALAKQEKGENRVKEGKCVKEKRPPPVLGKRSGHMFGGKGKERKVEEKVFQCPHCDMCFNRKFNWSRHQYMVHDVKTNQLSDIICKAEDGQLTVHVLVYVD